LVRTGGDRDDALFSQRKAEGRCNIARDSGYTKADKLRGSYFCLYFAKGLCAKGKTCEYLHRLPEVTDMFSPNVDCFGRDKHADYRDDMGGVGSLMRQNRTLYVGRVAITDDMEEIVSQHFSEWGQIERIRVLNNRGVAFVTYGNETNAQFAKEAMAHQSLESDEILNVRWATEDPNPMAQQREKRRVEEQAAEAIKKLLPASYVAEIEGKGPEARKRRAQISSFGLEGYEASDDLWFANGPNSINPDAPNIENKSLPLIEDAPPSDPQQTINTEDYDPTRNGLIDHESLRELREFHTNGPVAKRPKTLQLVNYDSDDD
jgi:hypothetical protein